MARGSGFRQTWMADATPRMILLFLDGAGPLGDPYQVNSANNGPYGDAVVRELIPYIEKQFRTVAQPHARFVDGASTGGWVSLALQVFYPDFFGGAWSQCPDPVDFRSFELINIYRDENAYVNRFGFERPAARTVDGDVVYTVRHECLRERVLGRGDRWELSGKDWGSWNAVFGPRGADGLPKPLWDGRTGQIDRSVVAHWQQYDLRMVLEKNWPALAPKLRGKIRIWVGEADDYFLNNAVHRLDEFLKRARPAAEHRITFGPGQGHSEGGWSDAQMMKEMAEVYARGGGAGR
jgi:Putative esterase